MNLYIIFKFIIFFWHVKDPSHVKVFGQSERALLETSFCKMPVAKYKKHLCAESAFLLLEILLVFSLA